MANHTILIIDYEPRNVEAASRPLENAGYTVETAADGVAGLKAFEKLAPALVLIEAMLPKKHGFEVCQEIKKSSLGKRTPVVITTAVYRGRKYRTQALHIYGADEYLEKPFTAEQVLEVCARFLGEAPDLTPEVEEKPIAVNEGVAAPPMASTPPAPSQATTEPPGAFSKIVGDLTEEEITERLDAILPAELSDPVDETAAPTETAQVAAVPADGGTVDDLPPEIAEAFIATEQPVTRPLAEEPVVDEAEPDLPEEPESVEAAQPALEDREEEPAMSAEAPTSDPVEEPGDGPEVAELDSGRGRKRRRKKKKRGARSKASKSKEIEEEVYGPEPDGSPALETAPEAVPAEAAAVPEAEEVASEPIEADEHALSSIGAPEPEAAEITVPEEAAPEEDEKEEDSSRAEPKSEAEDLADAVAAAIDQLQEPDETEAAPTETEEPVTVQEVTEEEAVDEPATDETVADAPSEAAEVPADPAPRRKTGLWMGLAAVLVVGLAVTLFFVLRGGGDGSSVEFATPKPTPTATRPSFVGQETDVASAAMVLGSGTESDTSEVVAAGIPTAKPGPPVAPPKPTAETPKQTPEIDETASEPVEPKVDEKIAVPQTTEQEIPAETSEPPVTTETDDSARVEEVEALAPAVAGAAAEMEPLDTQPSLIDPFPEPEADLPAEPEPAPEIENEPAVDEQPVPVTPTPAPKAATGDLVPLHLVDRQPTPLDQPRPSYPLSARRLKEQGTVVLNVLVDENGNVTDVELIRGVSEELDGAAIRAVRGWTYRPAGKDGVDVKVWKPEKVAFKL